MKHSFLGRRAAIAAVAFMAAACTMKEQEQPALTGPSEFGQSITVAVSPDVLTQDGASQSVVTVTARGPNGAALTNLSMRAEISVGGVPVDFGTLSARNVVTGSDGRATFVYTAPPAPAGGSAIDNFTIVDIVVAPVGTDFGNAVPRMASIRIVPRGIVVPPSDGLVPIFTMTPRQPTDNQSVLFDASQSTSASSRIVEYRWDFGDGDTGAGRTTSHGFEEPGTYVVTLTIVDAVGRTASTSESITVTAGEAPIARFTVSPTAVRVNQPNIFNAVTSTAAPGRRIVRYSWDFGDGSTRSGVQVSKSFDAVGTYVVTLTVTDDVGRVGRLTTNVAVLGP